MKKKKSKLRSKSLPNRCELLVHFRYDPLTGILTKVGSDKPIGWLDKRGYRKVRFNNSVYSAHRIIYYMYHGKNISNKVIDHCNGDPSDNRISNLRAVSSRINGNNTHTCRQREGSPVDIDCFIDHAEQFQAAVQEAEAAVQEAVQAAVLDATGY